MSDKNPSSNGLPSSENEGRQFPIIEGKLLNDWVLFNYKYVFDQAKTIAEHIENCQGRLPLNSLSGLSSGTPGNVRLATDSTLKLYRLVDGHIQDLERIKKNIRDEMIKVYPALVNDFGESRQCASSLPTPPGNLTPNSMELEINDVDIGPKPDRRHEDSTDCEDEFSPKSSSTADDDTNQMFIDMPPHEPEVAINIPITFSSNKENPPSHNADAASVSCHFMSIRSPDSNADSFVVPPLHINADGEEEYLPNYEARNGWNGSTEEIMKMKDNLENITITVQPKVNNEMPQGERSKDNVAANDNLQEPMNIQERISGEDFNPMIIKVESIPEPQDNIFSGLFLNPLDVETVDDEVPNSSKYCPPPLPCNNGGNSTTSNNESEADVSEVESMVSVEEGNARDMVLGNQSEGELIMDYKLGETVSHVLMEKLDPRVMNGLRLKGYILVPRDSENIDDGDTQTLEKNRSERASTARSSSIGSDIDDAIRRLLKPIPIRVKTTTTKPSSKPKVKPKTPTKNPQVSNMESDDDFSGNEEEPFMLEDNTSLNKDDSAFKPPGIDLRPGMDDKVKSDDEEESDDELVDIDDSSDSDGERNARKLIMLRDRAARHKSLRANGKYYYTPCIRLEDDDDPRRDNKNRRKRKPTPSVSQNGSNARNHDSNYSDRDISFDDEILNVENGIPEPGGLSTRKRDRSMEESEVQEPEPKKIRSETETSSDTSSGSDNEEIIDIISDEEDIPAVNPDSPMIGILKSKSRKEIRPILKDVEMDPATLEAEREELERQRRLQERDSQVNLMVDTSDVNELILEVDPSTGTPTVEVDKSILVSFKDYQRKGLKFMWDTCIESIDTARSTPGGGCIIAHCMGLGKSVQALGYIHTVLTCDALGFKSALVIGPKNTMPNWRNECEKWLSNTAKRIPIFYLWQCLSVDLTLIQVKRWKEEGGLAIISYNRYLACMNRADLLETSTNTRRESYCTEETKSLVRSAFLAPGPDTIVFDEGHILKNFKTKNFRAANMIGTKRRVILTGTPLQNNLREYYHIVNLVKPNFLGPINVFANQFINPIENGSYADSLEKDVELMKQRSHVLYKKVEGFIQRRDFSVILPYLPKKYEYTIHIKLSPQQKELYKFYSLRLNKPPDEDKRKQSFMQTSIEVGKICAHPSILKEKIKRRDTTNDAPLEYSDEEDEEIDWLENNGDKIMIKNKIRVQDPEVEYEIDEKTWIKPFLERLEIFDKDNIELSGKTVILMKILETCERIGDKVLIFSQCLTTLDYIEYMLKKWDEKRVREGEDSGDSKLEGYYGVSGKRWRANIEYFRLDGGVTASARENLVKKFNDVESSNVKVFLISTRAGGLGINLTGANRVVIFDESWNPANDLQSIFRIYRFGQTKNCYVYRLLSHATLEEAIYKRQILKLGLANRIVDEKQIARLFNSKDNDYYIRLLNLAFDDADEEDVPFTEDLPHDRLLADIISDKKIRKEWIQKYGVHDNLLQNRAEEVLTADEQRKAIADFQNVEEEEKKREEDKKRKADDKPKGPKKDRVQGKKAVRQQGRGNGNVQLPFLSTLNLPLDTLPQQSRNFIERLSEEFRKTNPTGTQTEFLSGILQARRTRDMMFSYRTCTMNSTVQGLRKDKINQEIECLKKYFGSDVLWVTNIADIIPESFFNLSGSAVMPPELNINNNLSTNNNNLQEFMCAHPGPSLQDPPQSRNSMPLNSRPA